MRFLKKNTAVIITVGPFYDKTDGVTIETGLTITNERITLTADTDDGNAPTNILDNVTGATSGTDNDLNYISGNDAGMMQLELSAANTNRVGRMLLSITDAANHVPVFHEFMVLDGAVYDSLVLGTDKLAVDAQEISSDSGAADNAEAFFDGTGYAGTNNVIPTVTTLTNANPTAAAVADAVWDEAATGHTDAGKAGEQLWTDVDAILVDTGTTLQGEVDGIQADTEDIQSRLPAALVSGRMDATVDGTGMEAAAVAAIADGVWDEALAGHVGAGSAGEALGAAGTAGDPWTTALPGAYGAGTAGKIIGDNINAPIATVDTVVDGIAATLGTPAGASVSADIAAIEAQTDDIGAAGAGLTALASQTSVNTIAGYLDTEIAAILAAVDTEVAAIVTAVGTTIPALLGTPAGASLAADILAIDNLVDDLESRLTALRAGYLDNLSAGAVATAASVAALNNLSAAQVNAEVVDALATDIIADSVPADGSRPTIAQALYMVTQYLLEKTVSGTTVTVKKPDGSTTLYTLTLNDGTSPTGVTRAT